MTYEKILSILKPWHDAMQECDARMDALSDLCGPVDESPLGNAVFGLMGDYTKTIASAIDWDHAALEDWWCSHNFGERSMSIRLCGELFREISTIEQLAQLIADDHAKAG